MRKQGVVLFVVVVVLLGALSLIFTDAWLERNLERYGSGVVGAKVEFDKVHFSLFDLTIRWDRLQVTDPNASMTNLFETAECELNLDPEPLLSKKFLMEKLAVQGLRFGTPRQSDGALNEEEKAAAEPPEFILELKKKLENEARQMPVFNVSRLTRKINVDSVYALLDLKTPARVDSLKKLSEQKFKLWDKRLAALPKPEELKALEDQLGTIDPQKINDLRQLKSSLEVAKNLQKQLKGYRENIGGLRQNFQADLAFFSSVGKKTSRWIEEDYRRGLALAQLPDISVKNVAKLLFGQKLLAQFETVVSYVAAARSLAEKYQAAAPAPDESPPRLHGWDIHFSGAHQFPKFWIQSAALSGVILDSLQVSGVAEHIVSDQRIINQPTEIRLSGERKDGLSLELSAVLDYRDSLKHENILLDLRQFPLKNVQLSEFALLPSQIASGSGTVHAQFRFKGNTVAGDVRFRGEGIKFSPEVDSNLNPRLRQIKHRLTNAITEVALEAQIEQQPGDFRFIINSNLDNLIARELQSILSGEVAAARKNLEKRIRAETGKYQAELNQLAGNYRQQLQQRFSQVDQRVKNLQKRIEGTQKAIEKKIKDKAAGKLKDFFKR